WRAGFTGVANVLDCQHSVRRGEVDDQPIFGSASGSERWLASTGVAYGLRAAVNRAGPDVEARPVGSAQWVPPVRLVDRSPPPAIGVSAESNPEALERVGCGRDQFGARVLVDKPIQVTALDQPRGDAALTLQQRCQVLWKTLAYDALLPYLHERLEQRRRDA